MYTYTYMHSYKLVYVHVCYNTNLSKFEPTTFMKELWTFNQQATQAF